MGAREFVKRILSEKENRRYERFLRERKVTYGQWVRELEKDCPETADIEDEFVVICGGQGDLAAGFLPWVRKYFLEHPEAEILYGDEDVWEEADSGKPDEAGRRLPWFKPDWSPDGLDSFFYFGNIVILRRDLFLRLREEGGREPWEDRGEPAGFTLQRREGMPLFYQAEDLGEYRERIRLAVRLAGGYGKGSRAVAHVPRILFHAAGPQEQDKFLTGKPALGRGRTEEKGEGTEISVVIPSRDQPQVLEKCVKSVLAAGGVQGGTLSAEIIIVDNGSSAENREKVSGLVRQINGDGGRAFYLYRPGEFHFSRMCNLGAEQAAGRLLLFLNDDVELCRPGCVGKMAALASRSYTGAVGLKLYYPDSQRIQHAGITNLPMGPVHKLQFLKDRGLYYYGANRGLRNVLAVTAACLMVEKNKFREAGGFPEELPVAFNDVDLCFRLYELGYHNVCVNEEYAYHYESLSRGADQSEEKLERLLQEREKLYRRHPALEGKDPYYSPFLNRQGLDTGIRPAFLTAGNRVQEISGGGSAFSVRGYRRDDCLMVRIEDCREGRILGYGVVLGDNNACYKRWLLFKKEDKEVIGKENETAEGSAVYAAALTGQYRPDLEENMPDQVRTGLCGFHADTKWMNLPPGRYRLGMAVRNRVTGLKLVNWSNRFTEFDGGPGGSR